MRRLTKFVLSIGSALGAAAVASLVLTPAGVLVMGVVIVGHEYGHYGAAATLDTEPQPPIFIPLVVGIWGRTTVRNMHPGYRSYIALAGPMTGAGLALVLLALALRLDHLSLALLAFGAFCFEIYSATYGSDRRRIQSGRTWYAAGTLDARHP